MQSNKDVHLRFVMTTSEEEYELLRTDFSSGYMLSRKAIARFLKDTSDRKLGLITLINQVSYLMGLPPFPISEMDKMSGKWDADVIVPKLLAIDNSREL